MNSSYASYIPFNTLIKKPNQSHVSKLPCDAINFEANDINGNRVKLSNFKGRGVLLCFFRDTALPARNQRLFELTRKYKEWNKVGVEIIVVFNETNSTLRSVFDSKPRPFPVIADPKLILYKKYGVQRIIGKDIVAPTKPTPNWINRMFKGKFAWLNPTGRIMPADFLINTDGKVISSWYGKSENDHIPNERLETFAIATRIAVSKAQSE